MLAGVACVAVGTLASAVGMRLIATKRSFLGGIVLVVCVGSGFQLLSYEFISESASASLGGLVVLWTNVLAAARGETVSRRSWAAAVLELTGGGLAMLSAPGLSPPTRPPRETWLAGCVVAACVLLSGGTHPALAGLMGGFTDTIAKAFVFSLDPFWGIAALVFAAAQLAVLQRALVSRGERAVNPVYMASLMVSVIAVGSVTYAELGGADTIGFGLGAFLAVTGALLV